MSVHDGPLPVELTQSGSESSHAAAWQRWVGGWGGVGATANSQNSRTAIMRVRLKPAERWTSRGVGHAAAAPSSAPAARTRRQVGPDLARACTASVNLHLPVACAGVCTQARDHALAGELRARSRCSGRSGMPRSSDTRVPTLVGAAAAAAAATCAERKQAARCPQRMHRTGRMLSGVGWKMPAVRGGRGQGVRDAAAASKFRQVQRRQVPGGGSSGGGGGGNSSRCSLLTVRRNIILSD